MLTLHLNVAHRSVIYLDNGPSAFIRARARKLRERRGYGRMSSTERAPVATFDERLPNVVLQPVGVRELLNEMFDRILSETEEVRSRDGV